MTDSLRLIAIWALLAASSAIAAEDEDAYAPLKLYEGKWVVTDARDGAVIQVENRCARTGLFFASEQVVNAKSMAIVVFLPRGRTAAGQTYRTQTLTASGDAPKPWYTLTVDGDRWVYAETPSKKGELLRKRTLNQFSGPDRIHFEVQKSTDGKSWTTTMSGEERRAP